MYNFKSNANMKTSKQYDKIIDECKNIFYTKNDDYGSSWRIFRPSSLTDQIFIKAKRIRSIQEKNTQKIEDDVDGEYISMINYSIMEIIQLKNECILSPFETDTIDIKKEYINIFNNTKELMLNKNHDYDEAWRHMNLSSIVDIILTKIFRIKQIERNQGKTKVSEGIESNLQDVINYSVFSLIKINENNK